MVNTAGRFNLTLVLLAVFFEIVNSQQTGVVGSSCTLQHTGALGRCEFLTNCPQAQKTQSQGNSPELCGFHNAQPIVCCPENTSNIGLSRSKRKSTDVGEKSKQKCREYGEYAKVRAPTAILFPGEQTVSVAQKCTFLEDEHTISSSAAYPKEFPHMAAIGFDEGGGKIVWRCTGALISERFVLTSAHCLQDSQYDIPKYIRIGDLNLDSDTDDTKPQNFTVIERHQHPEFKRPSFYNDIGLLKLDKDAHFNPYVRPACLDTNPILVVKYAVVAAWCRSNSTYGNSLNLLKDTMEFFQQAECNEVYKKAGEKLKNGVAYDIQVCAGPRIRKDMCVVEPGVLQRVSHEVDCTYKIVGVTSFGKACGVANIPDGFTRISAYIDWIEKIVWTS